MWISYRCSIFFNHQCKYKCKHWTTEWWIFETEWDRWMHLGQIHRWHRLQRQHHHWIRCWVAIAIMILLATICLMAMCVQTMNQQQHRVSTMIFHLFSPNWVQQLLSTSNNLFFIDHYLPCTRHRVQTINHLSAIPIQNWSHHLLLVNYSQSRQSTFRCCPGLLTHVRMQIICAFG